jgi:hypothetical protein
MIFPRQVPDKSTTVQLSAVSFQLSVLRFQPLRPIFLACHSERSEESGSGCLNEPFRARFLAEFTLSTQSEILRFAQDDSEGLGMTACVALPFES